MMVMTWRLVQLSGWCVVLTTLTMAITTTAADSQSWQRDNIVERPEDELIGESSDRAVLGGRFDKEQMIPDVIADDRSKQLVSGAATGLTSRQLSTLADLQRLIAVSDAIANRKTPGSPHRQLTKTLSTIKLKRQPFQCLVNVVSCWK